MNRYLVGMWVVILTIVIGARSTIAADGNGASLKDTDDFLANHLSSKNDSNIDSATYGPIYTSDSPEDVAVTGCTISYVLRIQQRNLNTGQIDWSQRQVVVDFTVAQKVDGPFIHKDPSGAFSSHIAKIALSGGSSGSRTAEVFIGTNEEMDTRLMSALRRLVELCYKPTHESF